MCKNLMNSFNECEEEGNIELSGGEEHGNNAQMFGDNAAQNAARDMPVDSNASEHSIYEQGQDQDENQDEAVREELKRFLNESDDGLRVPSGEDEEEWRKRRKRFNEEIAHQIASRWDDEGYDIAYEDLFAYAALEQSEQLSPVRPTLQLFSENSFFREERIERRRRKRKIYYHHQNTVLRRVFFCACAT